VKPQHGSSSSEAVAPKAATVAQRRSYSWEAAAMKQQRKWSSHSEAVADAAAVMQQKR